MSDRFEAAIKALEESEGDDREEVFALLSQVADRLGFRLEKLDPGPDDEISDVWPREECGCVWTDQLDLVSICAEHRSRANHPAYFIDNLDLEGWAKLSGILPWDARMGPL